MPVFHREFHGAAQGEEDQPDGKELKPAAGKARRLETLSWAKQAETVYASFPLGATTQMTVWLGE